MARKWTSSGSLVDIWTSLTPMQVLVAGLATDGVAAKLDRLWVFAQLTEALALVDIIANATATTVGSPTFTANRGYTGNGTTSYIDSNYNPATAGVKYIRDSASVSVWSNTSRAPANTCVTGGTDAVGIMDLYNYLTNGGFTGLWVRVNGGGGIPLTNNTSQGFFTTNRSSPTGSEGYYNGASLGSIVDVSSVVANINYWICTFNQNGVPGGGSTDQVAAVAYGGSLTAGEAASLYTRLRAYMDTVGVP